MTSHHEMIVYKH